MATCDCCGMPLPIKGYEHVIEKDGTIAERRVAVLHGNWALSDSGEDWLCPPCDRALMAEICKICPYSR